MKKKWMYYAACSSNESADTVHLIKETAVR
ncbi:iron ABC transporter iron-binding protein [Streptococcus pneumoniae]|nr:iron ABC transporter iron-binding protein [Streptococcus pneumoniae]VOG15211.1 iron ABC transporter iron-binding protein [Streptococcus pneumoniae]VSO56327.1 iron ABC transporter iron-binding protein [Streptococcus pneumoniae]